MSASLIIFISLVYLGVLFGLAYWVDRWASPTKLQRWGKWLYALSIPVYCTAWTFYGSVGKAAVGGWSFLTIYIGPLLTIPLWWIVLRKMIRICKVQHISTLSDFFSTRYNSITLSVLTALFVLVGIVPYISIQLKGITQSFEFLTLESGASEGAQQVAYIWSDSAFYLAIILAVFVIFFVLRNVETTGQHHGLMAALSFDSILKLVAFLAVGIFVSYSLFEGIGDIFQKADPALVQTYTNTDQINGMDWFFLVLLSMAALLLLPRQFQVMVAENGKEKHLKTAGWVFATYLLLINIFVVPVALGGNTLLGSSVNPDAYVLALPMLDGQSFLAILTYLGGLSAATGMIIVTTLSLSLMLSNNVIMPLAVKLKNIGKLSSRSAVRYRQVAVFIIILLAYFYYRYVAELFPLVSIGLISFAAIAQFIPAVFGALFWKDANNKGVTLGLVVGFTIWFYTLVLPTVVKVGLLPDTLLTEGLFGLSWLRPEQLMGLELDPITNGAFWSLLLNVSLFTVGSLASRQTPKERNMAELYANIYDYATISDEKILWKGELVYKDLLRVSENLLGQEKSREALAHYKSLFGKPLNKKGEVDSRFVNYTQRLLSGVVGSTSARILISSMANEEEIELKEVVSLLKQTSETTRLNSQLRLQSLELKRKTEELLGANERLRGLDKEKDDFISTVTHEMRTPLTSIKAFVEIIQDHHDLSDEERNSFLETINNEIDRMNRLIDQVLDLEKMEGGTLHLEKAELSPVELIATCLEGMQALFDSKDIALHTHIDDAARAVKMNGDADRLKQAFLNLLSNAVKYARDEEATIEVTLLAIDDNLEISVTDNGRGIRPENLKRVFDKFFQARDQTRKKPSGSGLGLSITKKIIELHGGSIDVFSEWGTGTVFSLKIPLELPMKDVKLV